MFVLQKRMWGFRWSRPDFDYVLADSSSDTNCFAKTMLVGSAALFFPLAPLVSRNLLANMLPLITHGYCQQIPCTVLAFLLGAKQSKDPSALQQSDRVRCHFLLRSSGSPSVWLCLHRALICCLLKFRQKDEPLVHCAVVIEGTEQFSYLSAWEAWAEVCPETSWLLG